TCQIVPEVPLTSPPSETSQHQPTQQFQSKKQKRITWTTVEHRRFLEGLNKYGKGDWKNISSYVKTKNSTQVASHAQKYYLRKSKSEEKKKRKSIHDMVHLPVSQSQEMLIGLPQNPRSLDTIIHPLIQVQEGFNPHMNMQIPFNPYMNMHIFNPYMNIPQSTPGMMQPNHMKNINHHPQQMEYNTQFNQLNSTNYLLHHPTHFKP
ncbi:hypothetical protein V8G54_034534, partial [Vigna mungo]